MHATFLQAAFPQQWKRKHFKMVKLLSNKVMLLLKEELGWANGIITVIIPMFMTWRRRILNIAMFLLKRRREQYIKGL